MYVDESDVREGALEQLKSGMEELVELIAANEPRILAYNVYTSDDGTTMTVVHLRSTALEPRGRRPQVIQACRSPTGDDAAPGCSPRLARNSFRGFDSGRLRLVLASRSRFIP